MALLNFHLSLRVLYSYLTLSPWRFTDLCLRWLRTDYNEEWFPINDQTWRDKTGQPYGKVPANLDWISYDVRPPATFSLPLALHSTQRFLGKRYKHQTVRRAFNAKILRCMTE